MPRPLLLLPLLLAGTGCHDTGPEHGQAVAARILPTCTVGLRPASLHTYQVSATELQLYLDPEAPRLPSGYLVTYQRDIGRPRPHPDTFAVFIDSVDQLREFVPGRNLGSFAQRYGVDYRGL